jgi:proteasome lid subunit RPN8/RPN11
MNWRFWRPKQPREKESKPAKPYWISQIRRDALELIFASARSQHPNEFGALLRAEKGVITEVLVLPGTVSGNTHAIFQLNMLPIDFSVKGTVHSHPSPNPNPSNADKELFSRFGSTHIIVARPYDERTWRAYNGRGEPIAMRVVE